MLCVYWNSYFSEGYDSIFSTHDCGWIVSDCTAEGLKALLILETESRFRNVLLNTAQHQLLLDCVDTLLQMQNEDGGYASYERKRGGAFLEVNLSNTIPPVLIASYSGAEPIRSVR